MRARTPHGTGCGRGEPVYIAVERTHDHHVPGNGGTRGHPAADLIAPHAASGLRVECVGRKATRIDRNPDADHLV